MIALNTPEERTAHHGIAIGFTEAWIREQIKDHLDAEHGDDHPRMTDNVIDHAFSIVLEQWEELETQPISDIIESACDDAWETDYAW
jgi:hypothetical protein